MSSATAKNHMAEMNMLGMLAALDQTLADATRDKISTASSSKSCCRPSPITAKGARPELKGPRAPPRACFVTDTLDELQGDSWLITANEVSNIALQNGAAVDLNKDVFDQGVLRSLFLDQGAPAALANLITTSSAWLIRQWNRHTPNPELKHDS